MDFLQKLFSSYKHQNQSKIQLQLISQPGVRAERQQISTALSFQQTCSSSSSFQSSSKDSSIKGHLSTKFLYLSQLKGQEVCCYPDFGVILGVIGSQRYNQKQSEFCNIVKVGQSQEINSLQALRKNSLDSLVVFFGEDNCQFGLKQIMLAQQRLIFVVQTQKQLQNLVSNIQQILCQLFEERPLNECSPYLCYSSVSKDKRYYVEFRDRSFFLKNFRNSLKKIRVQFQDQAQFQRLIKQITFKDFLNFRQYEPLAIKKIVKLRDDIYTESQNLKQKVQMQRLGSLLSTCKNEDEQSIEIKPIRKNSSMQADLQAEYFRKRMNDKRETQNDQDEQRNADLFYFIEEIDDNEFSEDQNEYYSKKIAKNKVKRYCKSEYAIESQRQEDLDQQFFTRQ